MTPKKDSLLLIDGHALLYRSFHAVPPLHTKNGEPTNAVYGFITTILKAFDDLKPKYCAVAFDVKGPTFRHQAYDGYKASRPDTPNDLLPQIATAYEVAKALNIPIFTHQGFEADDVIGTLAEQAKKHKIPTIIATGDRDAFQLVDDMTCVYTMKKSITDTALYDAEAVKEKMGVTPEQIADYKALAGDSSDEIPGIEGIGPKTAVTILAATGSLDNLYKKLKANQPIPEISDRIRQKLIDGEEIARQSCHLATIDRTVPIILKPDDCVIHDYDLAQVTKVFGSLEFYSLLNRLPAAQKQAIVAEQKRDWDHTVITTQEQLNDLVATLTKAKALAVDTETHGLEGPIIGISLAASAKEGYYIPLAKEHGTTLAHDTIAKTLKPLLENNAIAKVGHNIKYDLKILTQLGIDLQPISFDTMIAAYVLHAHLRSFDFDSTCQRELNYTPISFASVAGSKKKEVTLLDAAGDKVAEYAAEDAILTYRLFEHFKSELETMPSLQFVAQEIDFPLIEVLAAMELHGICLDTEQLRELSKELAKEIDQLRHTIESYATEPININSPIQLQKLLFDDLKLDKAGIKTTQKGMSTAAQELEKLQGMHPVIDDILRYRELTKLQSTYVETLPEMVDKSGRLHTQFSQTTAATGRLASLTPNLQNIPVRTELGNAIRKAFVPPKGYQLVSFDYSQFELRLIAHLANDPELKQVFLDGRDIHNEVSKRLDIDRRAAKAINFGIIYGLSAYGLSQALKIDPKVAKQYIDAYFTTYPKLHDYLEKTKQEIRTQGYVETLYGRRREIPEIKAANAIIRAQAERMAINAPAQGTEADIIKLAMIHVHEWLEKTYKDKTERPYLTLQVHDSLLLEVPKDEIENVTQHVKKLMESAAELSIPLVVDCSVGSNWGELEHVEQ